MLSAYKSFSKTVIECINKLTDIVQGHQGQRDKILIEWTPEHIAAYNSAKEETAVLSFLDPLAELQFTTAASNTAVGAILDQGKKDGTPSPLGFTSEKHTNTEKIPDI